MSSVSEYARILAEELVKAGNEVTVLASDHAIGIDCVEELVNYNNQTYGSDKVRFLCRIPDCFLALASIWIRSHSGTG